MSHHPGLREGEGEEDPDSVERDQGMSLTLEELDQAGGDQAQGDDPI